MNATTRIPKTFGQLVLRGERALLDGAGDAFLLIGIALGSAIGLVSLLAPAF